MPASHRSQVISNCLYSIIERLVAISASIAAECAVDLPGDVSRVAADLERLALDASEVSFATGMAMNDVAVSLRGVVENLTMPGYSGLLHVELHEKEDLDYLVTKLEAIARDLRDSPQ